MAQDKELDGINVDQLMSTIAQVKERPDMALFKFRAQNSSTP